MTSELPELTAYIHVSFWPSNLLGVNKGIHRVDLANARLILHIYMLSAFVSNANWTHLSTPRKYHVSLLCFLKIIKNGSLYSL